MAKLYRNMILDGRKTLSQVPTRWREETKALLIEECVFRVNYGIMNLESVPEEVREEVAAIVNL